MRTCRVDIVPLIPGACVVGNTGLGVLGREVPLTGPDGPPFGLIDLEAGDDDAEVRWEILTRPANGRLTVAENSSFFFDNGPSAVEGTEHFYVRGFRNGQDRGIKLVAITVGDPRVPADLTLRLT